MIAIFLFQTVQGQSLPNSGIYALIGSLIGAFTVIITQTVIQIVQTRREKQKLSRELIAEAVGITHIIRGLCAEVGMFRTNKHYFRRLAQIHKGTVRNEGANLENEKETYQKLYFERDIKAREIESKIQTNTSVYLKCLTHLRLLKGDKNNINKPILIIKEFVKPNISRFNECVTSVELGEAATAEELKIKSFYVDEFISHFEEINKCIAKDYK